MKINFFSIIILSAVLAPAPGLAADTSGNSFFPEREQIKEVIGSDIGTYQEAAQEAAKQGAQEQKSAPAQNSDFGLQIGKALLGLEDSVKKAFSGARRWFSVERETWISAAKGMKDGGFIPFTKESEARRQRVEGLRPRLSFGNLWPFRTEEIPRGITQEEFPKSTVKPSYKPGSDLEGPLSDMVLNACRSGFDFCVTCPRLSGPEAFKYVYVSDSCHKCVLDDYDRLKECRRTQIKKPVEDVIKKSGEEPSGEVF
ncbi:MAG: hypothetical protein Q8Q97_01195 [bacterium]|nr:hypothetical protein [bacterium]